MLSTLTIKSNVGSPLDLMATPFHIVRDLYERLVENLTKEKEHAEKRARAVRNGNTRTKPSSSTGSKRRR